jgi:hypothetical protein
MRISYVVGDIVASAPTSSRAAHRAPGATRPAPTVVWDRGGPRHPEGMKQTGASLGTALQPRPDV